MIPDVILVIPVRLLWTQKSGTGQYYCPKEWYSQYYSSVGQVLSDRPEIQYLSVVAFT